jgi:hypothetical protein
MTPPTNGFVCIAYLHQGYVKHECIYVRGYFERDVAYVVRLRTPMYRHSAPSPRSKREANVR